MKDTPSKRLFARCEPWGYGVHVILVSTQQLQQLQIGTGPITKQRPHIKAKLGKRCQCTNFYGVKETRLNGGGACEIQANGLKSSLSIELHDVCGHLAFIIHIETLFIWKCRLRT